MDETNDLYRQYLLDVYKHLTHKHALPESDTNFSFETYNASCGDKIAIHIKLNDEKTVIEEMSFTGEGCLLSTVSAELLVDAMQGKKLSEVTSRTLSEQLETMGIHPTPTRMKCIELPLLSANHLLQLLQTQ